MILFPWIWTDWALPPMLVKYVVVTAYPAGPLSTGLHASSQLQISSTIACQLGLLLPPRLPALHTWASR